MSRAQTILGPILNPRADGTVDFYPDGALACDDAGIIRYAGPAAASGPSLASSRTVSHGIICPPFLDAHTHIPQWPIRGEFMRGIEANPPGGWLIAGLERNVFPAEARCADPRATEYAVTNFLRDTLANGVVGGSAYMTVHPSATRIARALLPPLWFVGLVLMNQNCPDYLRTDEATIERDLRELAETSIPLTADSLGAPHRSFIVTDRFALAVSSRLRRLGVSIAKELGLRMQTHLNEQLREKAIVEQQLYPDAASYTDVYRRDGLLDCDPILAHCIHMRPAELEMVAASHSGIAHCPTSNTLLCSGIMPLDQIMGRGIDYAICTDVGASPTTSMLAEMAQFLKVHAGRSRHATPQEALFRATLAPAHMMHLDRRIGSLEVGKPMSFIEVEPFGMFGSTDEMILTGLLGMTEAELNEPDRRTALDALEAVSLDVGPQLHLLDADVRATAARLENRVRSVTLEGSEVFRRREDPAV